MLELLKNVFASSRVAPDARLDTLRYIVLDTEFTSLDSRSNRLLSIGAVAMSGAKIRIGEQFYRVTNPGVDLPGNTVVVHKLRAKDIEHAESPRQVVVDFSHFAEDAVLVGHFLEHDLQVLDKEARLAGLASKFRSRAKIDTAHVYRWNELHRMHYPIEAFDERTIKVDLASVAVHYGVTFDEAHHALADAFVTAQIWQKQIAIVAGCGIERWNQLRRLTSKRFF